MTEVLSWEAENYMWDEIAEIRNEYQAWNEIAEHGCSDPFWPDGANMNIIRNHILCYKKQLISKAEKENAPIPQEAYWPVPPLVPEEYMVKSGKSFLRYKKWNRKIVLKADTDWALF